MLESLEMIIVSKGYQVNHALAKRASFVPKEAE